jgi:hypothetical protein
VIATGLIPAASKGTSMPRTSGRNPSKAPANCQSAIPPTVFPRPCPSWVDHLQADRNQPFRSTFKRIKHDRMPSTRVTDTRRIPFGHPQADQRHEECHRRECRLAESKARRIHSLGTAATILKREGMPSLRVPFSQAQNPCGVALPGAEPL